MSYFDAVLDSVQRGAPGYTARGPIQPRPDELDLSAGELRFHAALSLVQRIESSLRTEDFCYNTPAGSLELRNAYIDALRRDLGGGVQVAPANVLVTSGAKQALWLAIALTVRRSDVVLVPQPGWAPYRVWCESVGARVATYDAGCASAASLIETAKAAKATVIVLNSPCNPTGVEFDQHKLDDIALYAAQGGVALVSDEVYRGFGTTGGTLIHHVGRLGSRVLVADAVSKWAGAAGLRVGFLVAQAQEIASALTLRAMIDSCPPGITQRLAAGLLSASMSDYRQQLRDRTRRALDALAGVLHSEGVRISSRGALYLWAPTTEDAGHLSLLKAGVVLRGARGELFGAPGFVRLCPACDSAPVQALLGLEAAT